jgi:hypothetical protein
MSFTHNNILLIVIIIVILLFIYCITISKTFEFFDPDVNTILTSEYNSNISNINSLTSSLKNDIDVLSTNFTITPPNTNPTGMALTDFNYISDYINNNAANYLNYTDIKEKYKEIYNKIYQIVTDNNAQRTNYASTQ